MTKTTPKTTPKTTIPEAAMAAFVDALAKANASSAERHPGERPARQPVHTMYGGAHLFKADAIQRLGAVALRAMEEYAPNAAALAEAIGLDPDLAARIYPRIVDKLTREPIEDFRLDFEDGFGIRADEEEDRHAYSAADEVAAAFAA